MDVRERGREERSDDDGGHRVCRRWPSVASEVTGCICLLLWTEERFEEGEKRKLGGLRGEYFWSPNGTQSNVSDGRIAHN